MKKEKVYFILFFILQNQQYTKYLKQESNVGLQRVNNHQMEISDTTISLTF